MDNEPLLWHDLIATMSQARPPHIVDSLQPEMALLVACARSQLTEEHKSIIHRLLDKELDWDNVINNAIYHKVIPLLHRSLSTSFRDKVPVGAMSRITTHLKESSLLTFVITASLLNVIRLLQENEIPVLPVKGAILAEKLYGSPTMRSYTDVDILVHQANLEKALKLLQENNYTLLPVGIPQATFLKFLKYNHHGRLRDRNSILIELHWELSGFYAPEPITLEKLEPFLTNTVFNNCPTLTLNNEMLFIFLCLHGNKHCWEKLDYIFSMAELVNVAPDLDWNLIMKLGEKHQMTKRIFISLFLMKQLFATTIPEQLTDGTPALNRLADRVIKRITNPNRVEALKHPALNWIYFQANAIDGRLNMLRYIFRSIVVPEHDEWLLKMPKSFFLFYFIYKPFLMLKAPISKRIQSVLHSINKSIVTTK